MNIVTIKKNGSTDRVTFHASNGDQVLECGNYPVKQRIMMNEVIVDYWCKQNGYAPIHSD